MYSRLQLYVMGWYWCNSSPNPGVVTKIRCFTYLMKKPNKPVNFFVTNTCVYVGSGLLWLLGWTHVQALAVDFAGYWLYLNWFCIFNFNFWNTIYVYKCHIMENAALLGKEKRKSPTTLSIVPNGKSWTCKFN
jgi:hypothetical protein